jgi:hypothetical protein
MQKEKKSKKELAYLYFRENNKGGLNIKFGPDIYSKDTEKFGEILLSGNLRCLDFLSILTKEEPMEVRMAQYENIRLSYNSLFDTAFPDVFEEKKRIMGLEEEAIRKMESGEPHDPEFLKQVEAAKEKIKQRSTQIIADVSDNNKKFISDVEEQLEILTHTQEVFRNQFNPEKDDRNINYKVLIDRMLEEKIDKLKELYGKSIEENYGEKNEN